MGLRSEIHRGIPGNARQRVPTPIGKRGWMWLRCRDAYYDALHEYLLLTMPLSTRGSASGPLPGRDAAPAGPRHSLMRQVRDGFAERDSSRDSRERAAARPYPDWKARLDVASPSSLLHCGVQARSRPRASGRATHRFPLETSPAALKSFSALPCADDH
jgi:hypothetical protein